ncbi:MAG: response regulator [Phormidesmis sp.]
MKFLLVEDDQMLADAIEQLLSEHHYVMDLATDGIMGQEMAEAFSYDLILLDWMLPQLDGMQLCKRLRNKGNDTPIILMTAREASTDKVAGLDAGADDYLVKPFEFEELLARIRALLRRAEGLTSPILQWGELRLDPRSSEVTCHDLPIAITPKEYALLELFLRNPNRIFSLDTLLDKVWPFEDSPTVGSVRTHIKGLRQKLKKAGLPDMIATVYGLGYRLKPPESDSESEVEASQVTSTDSVSTETTGEGPLNMASLWQSVSAGYVQRVVNLATTLRVLQPGPVDSATQAQILTEAHALAGSLGSFGFSEATAHCRQIESILSDLVSLSAQQVSQLKTLAMRLQQVLESFPEAAPETPLDSQADRRLETQLSDQAAPPSAPDFTLLSDELPLGQLYSVLVVKGHENCDLGWLRSLSALGPRNQMQVSIAENTAEAKQMIAQQQPGIVVFDLDGAIELPDSDSTEFRWLAEFRSSQPSVPVLILTAAASFENRVRVARMGVSGLLQAPVSPTEVLEVAVQILQKGAPPAGKLLMVDDDPAILTLLQVLLQPWGFRLELLSDPQHFWRVLEQFEPDLVVLDAKMPQISGFEICQVLRSAPRWHDLPVVFMSGYTDADTIQQVFAVGADDYIRKPIVAPELVARVLGWLERGRIQRLRADVDNLTGVANRRKSTQLLTRLLRLAQRQEETLCFAVIDFDHFKRINDEYGHPMGDRLLRHFGESLRATFRTEDVTGRWGGEEFVVGLYGVSRQEGTQRLRQFLQRWQQEQFEVTFAPALNSQADSQSDSPDSSLSVTFTAGVAAYPEDATDLQGLYRVADEALYKAKAAGRNRVYEASQ